LLVLVFTGVVLVDLVTILEVVFKAVVPYWRNNHCLNVSMVMLLFIIVEWIVTHPDLHVCCVRNRKYSSVQKTPC
jgi:hypothetical protein